MLSSSRATLAAASRAGVYPGARRGKRVVATGLDLAGPRLTCASSTHLGRYGARVIVSATQRLLFVHVQKTGGLSVANALQSTIEDAVPVPGLPDDRHVRLATACRARPELADFWTFGFVRNPWARLYSWHSMIMRRHADAAAGHERARQRLAHNKFWLRTAAELPTFEAFVLRGPDVFPRLATPQLDYLTDGDRRADFIGRTEHLGADLVRVFRLRGLDAPPAIPRLNAGPKEDHRLHYTPEMRDKVATVFRRDIEEFAYTF
jgi:hypothetical protein